MKTKSLKMWVAPLFMGMTLTACGGDFDKNSDSNKTMSAVGFIHTFKNESDFDDVLIRNVIEVQKDMFVQVRKNIDGSSTTLSLKEGDSFTVLKKEKDKNGKEYVQIYLEDENQSDDVQEVVWISVDDFDSEAFVMVDLEDPFDDNGEEIVELESEDSQIMTSAQKKKSKKRGKKKMTYCYRFVKIRLQKLGLVKVYLPGGSAYQAAGILPKHGFKRTSRGVGGARINDVCVYTGGNGGNGHIEIRTAGGWWYGYGVKSHSIGTRSHRLIACFSKG